MTMIMMMFPKYKSFSLSIIAVLLLLHDNILGKTRALSVPFPRRLATTASSPLVQHSGPRRRLLVVVAAAVPRYGPSNSRLDRTGSDDKNDDDDDSSTVISSSSSSSPAQNLSELDRKNFKQLVQQVMSVRDAQHIPSLLTQNMELLFSVISASGGTEGVALVQDILNDFPEHDTDDDDDDNNDSDSSSSSSSSATRASRRQVEKTIDLMLSFAQDFVDQASQLDNQNKRLLGKIIKVISPAGDNNNNNSNNNNTPKQTAWQREEALDKLLEQERDFLSAGFLRHLQGECKRIANAPTMTRESSRLLQVLSMIQTLVLEEMVVMDPKSNSNNNNNNNENNNKLGEAAMVFLGQLIGYETKAERLAVLDAGLLVRNNNNNNGSDIAFAQEMRDLTLEALDGFNRVVGGADPGLVQIIQEIDTRLEQFLVNSAKKKEEEKETS